MKPTDEMKKYAKEYYAKHQAVWDWLYNNPIKSDGHLTQKSDCPLFVQDVPNYCFACAFCALFYLPACNDCLLVWNNRTCGNIDSEFYNWCSAETSKERKIWAEKIRDLKINPIYL